MAIWQSQVFVLVFSQWGNRQLPKEERRQILYFGGRGAGCFGCRGGRGTRGGFLVPQEGTLLHSVTGFISVFLCFLLFKYVIQCKCVKKLGILANWKNKLTKLKYEKN